MSENESPSLVKLRENLVVNYPEVDYRELDNRLRNFSNYDGTSTKKQKLSDCETLIVNLFAVSKKTLSKQVEIDMLDRLDVLYSEDYNCSQILQKLTLESQPKQRETWRKKNERRIRKVGEMLSRVYVGITGGCVYIFYISFTSLIFTKTFL